MATLKKRVLIGLSEWGFWGEELVGPLWALDAAGYETVFFTAHGKRARPFPRAWTRATSILRSAAA